ncbi:hypothetical protein BT96DRAFT_995307 [Gymnopus androsaceus JB14]|uniref:DUF6830 domain-containing protein n=1 Tax=Gymnopus androsaceus JB14 TaxID=1447944 RepID=A0A6A4HHI5_9AGAR|nr:hypothetical protein BT96DRAFT_995307 [Gymnopus androsaceus JB14]
MKDCNIRFNITETPTKLETHGNHLDDQFENGADEASDADEDDAATGIVVSTALDLQKELEATLISKKIRGATFPKQDFFLRAEGVKANPNSPKPFWVFTDPSGTCAAMSVTRDPDYNSLTIGEAAVKFRLPGLQGVLKDYLHQFSEGTRTFLVGRP